MSLHDLVRDFEGGAKHLETKLIEKLGAEQHELANDARKLYQRFLSELTRLAHVVHPTQADAEGPTGSSKDAGKSTSGDLQVDAALAQTAQSTSASGTADNGGAVNSGLRTLMPVQPIAPTVKPNQEAQTPIAPVGAQG